MQQTEYSNFAENNIVCVWNRVVLHSRRFDVKIGQFAAIQTLVLMGGGLSVPPF